MRPHNALVLTVVTCSLSIQFEASPLVARLKSGAQLCQVANMIYNNADENPSEVQKALFLWRKAIDKVRH